MNDSDSDVVLRPAFNSIDAAWRSFSRNIPEMDDPVKLAAFIAGASAALSIIYRNGFANLSRELSDIQEELDMANIVWQELKSSNVSKIAYDSDADELLVEYKSGGIYSYPSAGEAAYQDLLYSTSPGQYVNRWLKGQPSRRVK